MPQIFSTSRAEATLYRFPSLFFPVLIILALVAQAYLPLLLHWMSLFDFPLLAVVYIAMIQREAGVAMVTGTVLGLLQDSLAHLALGVNGISKTLVGYLASSLGVRIDADHPGVRLLTIFSMSWLNAVILYCLERYLLGRPLQWNTAMPVVAAAANGLLGMLLFRVLDRFRRAA